MKLTHEDMEREQVAHALQLFYDALPADHRALIAEMAAAEGSTVLQLCAAVWSDKIEAYSAPNTREVSFP